MYVITFTQSRVLITMKSPTPLKDVDEKLDIIEHINQDHTEEVAVIVADKYPKLSVASAKIADIFVEGMMVTVMLADDSKTDVFIKFELEGELEEQILYLAYLAMTKQGKDLSGTKKHYFEVVNKQQLTPSITRLTLKSALALPNNYGAYAYGMVLKTLNKPPANQKGDSYSIFKKIGNHALLWMLKKMSSDRRQKMVEGMNKHLRLYTLRKSWSETPKNNDDKPVYFGYMDVFTHTSADHGKSAGSLWVEALQGGDIVFSRTEAEDNHSYLNKGHNVLIADESAYPAVAGILDLWENPILPTLIIVSCTETEQGYFETVLLPKDIQIHRVVANVSNQADIIMAQLDTIPNIDGIWAGLESQVAKQVRHHARNTYQLSGKTNHVKGYWKNK